jgi:hypothetical protein
MTTDHISIAQALLVRTARSLPGGIGIALPETILTLLPDAKKRVGEETTRGHLLLRPKNATTNVENAGVHLLHAAKTTHEAYLLDLDASNIELLYISKATLDQLWSEQSNMKFIC